MTAETGSGPGETDALRPEARPLPYAELDGQQQAALTRVVGLLKTATDAVQPPARDRQAPSAPAIQATPAGPYLESTRCSRNILIGGERGTGKTTLMLSLARLLSTQPDAQVDKSLPQAVADQVRTLYRRLVWLETLDMEPLAPGANLLGAVLARVEDAVGARFPGLDKPPETVPLLYPGASHHDMSREMARLQTSVALIFDGNLSDRAGSLDPDTFAVESRRAERERLGLGRRFAGVLAGLSATLANTALANTAELTAPVFVLPVDDVDLNLSACVPLLRLLRATSSPHLVVMLAADVGLLSTIVRLNYVGELARISGTARTKEVESDLAGNLAASALRKHLPPAQRVVLGLAEPRRALALRPLGPGTRSLGQVLGRVDLPADTAALQLDPGFSPYPDDPALPSVVTTCGWSGGPDDQPAQLAERLRPFTWPEVLCQTMREVVDLYLDYTRAEEERQAGPLIHDVTDPPLIQLARDRLDELAGSLTSPNQHIRIYGRFEDHPPDPPGEALMVGWQSWHGWRAEIPFPLETADAAVLVGCIDLLRDRWEDAAPPPLPDLRSLRMTWWPGGAATTARRWIRWPWVTHTTFWGHERALAWLREADEKWRGQPDAMFGSWVAVMTAQLFDAPGQTPPSGQEQPFDRPTQPFACDWPSLAERLMTLDETPLGQAWLNAVGLLCTPEMGMTFRPENPPLLPPERAGRVQRLRDQRRASLPPALQTLVTGEQAAEAKAKRPPSRVQHETSAPRGKTP